MVRPVLAVAGLALALLWETVYSQYDFKCGSKGKESVLYTKGDLTYICFHFMPYKVRLGFPIKIDQYTGFEIPDSFTFFHEKPADRLQVHAQLDVYPQYSDAGGYLWKSADMVVSVMHLVIELKDGNLQNLYWDNACYGCNNTDKCRTMKTDFIDGANKQKTPEYKTCAEGLCKLDLDNCNLKVIIIFIRFSFPSRAQTSTATT